MKVIKLNDEKRTRTFFLSSDKSGIDGIKGSQSHLRGMTFGFLSIVMIIVMLSCGAPKDAMTKPYNVKSIELGVNNMLEKIDSVGTVRWFSVDLKAGDRIMASASAGAAVGVQLHVDMLDEAGKVIATGKDESVSSKLNARVEKEGKYLFRVFDRGMDQKTSGLLSGFTMYAAKE